MIALRNLNNANDTAPPEHAVRVERLFQEPDALQVGELDGEKEEMDITFAGHPLILRCRGTGYVSMHPSVPGMKVVVMKANRELAFPAMKMIYAKMGLREDMREMLYSRPEPKLFINPSRLDQMGTEQKGVATAFPTWELFSEKVRCINEEGKSSPISVNMEYSIEVTVRADKLLFKHSDSRLPKDGDYDFFVCVPTKLVCVTLFSPTNDDAPYGAFGSK